MFDEQDRQYFYNEFKNNGYEVGSYDDFKKDLNNEEDRNWYYNEAKNMGYDVGTQADFDKMVLEPAPSTSSSGGKQVNASKEAKPQVQPSSSNERGLISDILHVKNESLGDAVKDFGSDFVDKLKEMPGKMISTVSGLFGGANQSQETKQPSVNNNQPQNNAQQTQVEVSPEAKEEVPITTPTGVVNNEGMMDAKLANYLENWKQRPDKQSTYFENLVADLLADGTANSNEEAVNMVMPALHRYANRSAMDVTNQVVSSLPDDTVQDAEKSIEAQWYSHGVQDKLKQEAYNMGISYDDYVGLFLKPAMVQSLVNKYGPNYRNIAEGIATRLYSHDENVQDRLMNQDINDALSSVISKYVNPSVVDEYNKAQEAGSKAFTEGMEGSQFIPANLRLGTALGAQYEANEAKDPAKVLSSLQKKFGRLYRNPEFLNDMSNAAFKVMQRYGLNGTQSSDPKQFKPMINSVLKNELDQLEIKGMMPKGSAEYIMKTGLGNTIVGKITRKAVQTDYQNWLEDIANQQYQPGFWENVASGALTFAGDAWSYWLPGAAGGKLTKSMVAKAEGKLAGDLMAKGMERKMAERAAKVLIGKSKAAALKSGAAHGAVTFGGQSAISKPIDETYRTGQFDENGKIYNPSGWKIALDTLLEGTQQSALGVIMQGNTIANMLGKGRGLATNILADIGGKVVDSGIMTGHQMLERMAQDPNFKPTGKDAAETFLESGANLLSIGFPGFVGKYARFKDAREFNKKFDFTDQDIAELKRFGYDGLRDAFEKVGIGEYAVVGENAQRLDGQLTQKYMDLMNDKSVPEVLKAKMMAVVEGKRPSSFSPVVDSIIVQPMDNDGKVYLETLNKNGGIVERKEFASLDEAQKADKKLEYEKTLGLASVLEGEFHNEFTQEHLDGLYNKAAQKYNMGEKLTDEDKAAVYLHQNAGAIKEIMDKQQKGIILTDEEQKQVNAYRHYYDNALENSSVMREFVNTFEDSHGVARGTLRKALESKDKKYAPLVESYLKELYNSIELKREMKQIEDDKKRIEQGDVDGAKPATPVEGPASVEGSAGGQEPPVSEGSSPYQGNTDASSSQGEGGSTVNVDNSSADVITSDAFVMGQNAYKNGDSEALQAIDYNSDLATGRLKRAFADNEKMPDIVANAYNEGRDMEQFVAQRASSLTPAQKEAISKYVEAMDAKKGAIDALQHADDGYGDALKEQLWPYQTEDRNIVPATLDSGKQVFLKKANEYGGAFVVVPDEQGQPTIKQVSNAEIKEVGTPVSLDEYIENAVAQQKDARAQQFISQFDGSGLKPNDQVAVAMEEGDANVNMTFAGYSEDGKIVLTDGKDYLPLSKEEFAAWRKNALDNTINEHLDAEDDEREQAQIKKAEADKQERYKKGIFGYAVGKPDYSDTQTDPKVAAEYLQETAGEDRKALFANIVAEKQALQKRINQLREHIANNEEWLSVNADLDPENAETRSLANKQMQGQIVDLQARFDQWNKIRSAVMTPEEAEAIKADRTKKIAEAGVNDGDVAPIEGREVAVLSDEELKKQYPTMDEASNYITSERKRIYRIQSDEVQREIDGVDDVLDRYVNGEIDLEPEQLKELNTTKAQLQARQANLTESAKDLKAQADKLKTLYRKENMEARAKAMENMTPAEQRAVKVENALKNGNLSQLNSIYEEVRGATDFTDTEPNTIEEYVANNIGRFSLNYEGKDKAGVLSNGIKQETGLGRKDFDKLQILAKEGEGKTVPEFVHSLYDNMPEQLKQMGYSDQDIRDAFLNLISSVENYSDLKNYTLKNKVAEAEQLMRDLERQEEEMLESTTEEETTHSEAFNKIVELAKEQKEYWDLMEQGEVAPDDVPEVDVAHDIDELLKTLSDEEFKEVSDVLQNIDEEFEYFTADEYERREGVVERKKKVENVNTYEESIKEALKPVTPFAYALKSAVESGDKKAIKTAQKELTDALIASDLGHDYLSGQLAQAKLAKKKDELYKVKRATIKPLTDAIRAIESAENIENAPFADRLQNAIAETETEPTEAQKKAGNYKKGHLSFGGYDFTVETPKGVTRSGKDEQGKPWSVTMHDTYGYILGKIGVDGDHIDMFINDAADLDTFDGNVYVVDQVNPETGEFDEHKVMYGYPDEAAATKAYLSNYSKGWKGLGKVTAVPKATFDKWLESSDRKTKPFRDYAMIQHEQAKKANETLPFDAPMSMDDLPFHRDVKEVKPENLTEAQKVAYDAVSTMLKKAGIPVKVVSNEDMEKVAEAQDNLAVEMLLNDPRLRFYIKTPEQKESAKAAYDWAAKNRPDKFKQYAIVNMDNPNQPPQYFEKKDLAEKWRKYYTNAWKIGNYKAFNLNKTFEEQIKDVKGDVPSEFDPYKVESLLNKRIELEKQIKETEDSYNAKKKERAEYQNQLMQDYMDQHGLSSENDIPDDVWTDYRDKSFEKYQDTLDDLFHKYVELDNQLKAVAEPGVRFLRTYHGSGASFDKFDLSHALEGEGSETFGHGVYVTSSREIGREYAQRAKQKKMANLYKTIRYPDGVMGDTLKRRLFGEMVNDVATGGDVKSAKEFAKKRVGADANDVERTLEHLKDREKGTEYEQNLKDGLAKYKDALKWIDSLDEDYLTQGNANRYDVDIPDDNGENYLGWNDSQNFPLEKWYRLWEITHHGFNENEYFKDGGANYDKDRIERIIQMKLDSPENGMQKLPTLKGEELYHALEDFFDRERPSYGAELASRALGEIGFVGIKYPAGMIHGGAKEGDYNYVIFDENNANIVGNTKFAQGKGVVYGYTDGKQIVLNQEHLNPNTPIHEYQHLWRTAAKNMNPELIEHGDKLIMQTQLFADLKQDPNYNHLTDEQICDEAFARLTGEDGAAILEQMAKDAIKENPLDTAKELSVINKLKEWLKKFWYWTLDTFTKWKPEDIKKMTLEDIRNLVLRDLANGVDPRIKLHEAENADDIKFMGSTTKKRMKNVASQFEGRDLDKAQQVVADVYSGKDNNRDFSFTSGGSERTMVMRQGNDDHAGTKHSLYRHFGVSKNYITIDDILSLPKILNVSTRKPSKKGTIEYSYTDKESGVTYTVVTKPVGNKEHFQNFYSDRKANPSDASHVAEGNTYTPEGARKTDGNAFMRAKVDNNSETTKGNDGNLSLEDKIKAVSQQFGVDEADVAMYANGVKKGSTAEAARARANIKRHLLQVNEGNIFSFKDLVKYTVPVNNALKENFGDLDAMIEERVKQVEAQRNAMEAARKRAEEEEAKRQKHLEELSQIPDDQLDKQYMDALAKGDDATAREMLDEAARRKGYDDTESSYQGVGAWKAPGNPGYESDKARRDDWESSGSDVNLEDMALGYTPQPDDYFSHPERYSQNTPHGLESVKAINTAIDAIKNGEKDVKVKVYRAVPTSVKEGKLRNGDWVTPSKKYAEMHGTNRLEGKYRIIEDEVPATQLWWDGNDANEFGFDDGKEYKYKNAKNNRKLNDLVTYDDKGDVILPSKRFNSRKSDVRFHRVTEPEELERLNKEKTFRMYSGMQELDGKLYSPMAAIIDGKRTDATEIGAWMGADERPDLVKGGKFQLVKTDKNPGAGEGPVRAAYNPYMHTSTSMMNDQFTGAYARGNIKVVEWEIPESEKTSGYHAEGAKDAVGLVPWHSGSVNGLLSKDRQRSVMLSRWRKAVRVVPDSEVAESIAEQLEGTGLAIPWNVVTPNQVRELVKLGVPITTVESGQQAPETKEKFMAQMEELKKEFPQAQFVDVKMTKEAFKEWGGKGIVKSPILEQKLKKHPDSLMKAGTYFSGGGLVEEGLKGIIDPVVAVEYDRKISGVYRNNFGQHIVTADVRDVDPKELVKHIDGEVEYFHASPVCKNYSQAKSNSGEVELDKETAKSTADFIDAVKPRVVTIENVKGYKDSEAMKIITRALDKNGYTWDSDVYNAADYGGYTSRERLIVRTVKDGELPGKPKKQPRKGGWLEAVEDILPTLTVKESGVAPWMDARLKVDGIDWQKVEKPLYVMGSAYADGKIPHAYGDEILPTLRTKSGDVIIMPGGKVLRADGRVLARITGLGDDYKLPKTESLAHTIIGNGIPVQLTKGVIAPLLNKDDLSGRNVLARLGSSIIKNNWDADKQKQVSDRVVNTANKLGGAEATVYTSVDEVPDAYLSDVKNGATGWYDPTTHTVHVYLPNCADANEAERTVLHEKIGHEGMEVLLGGEDGVRKFANFVYNSVAASTRGKILDIANKYDPDWKNPDRMNVGTQEYIAHLAEEGPKTAEDFSLWTKIKHYLIKVLKKLGVRVPGLLNDKDLRYYLMKAGKALHVWDEMPQEKQEAMMKQASNAEIKDALSDGAGKGKPRQKKGESTIQYMKRVQEWRKWQNAREDKENPEPPMFYDIDKDEAGKKEWAQLNKDWRERHHLVGEEPTGMPIRMENEEDDAYMNRIHEYEKWQAAMKEQEDPLPDMFAFEKKKQEEVKRKYEDWLAKHDLLEQQQADLDLYEGKIYPAETNPKADALEQQVMQDLAEVTSTDVSKEGAAKTVKHAVIHRRKNMEEASADDAIYINDVKNRIEKMADSGAFDKLLSDYQGKPNRAEKLAEAIPYIIEAPRRLRDLAHDLNATGAFDKGHIHILPADVEAIQPFVADLIAETAKKHTELKDGKEVEVYDDPQAVGEVASKMAQSINANHQGEEGFVPIDGSDILSEHVLPLVKQQIVPEGIDYKNLSPEMKAAIDSIRDWYNYTYDWLKDNHTLREDTGYNADYVNHIWDKEKSDKQAYAMYVENRQRTKSPNEKPRTISTLMEGISVGLVPKTTDITKMMAYYSRSNIEAWVNKTMLQELSGLNVIERNEDGEIVSSDPLLSSTPPFNLEQYQYFEIPGVGPVWVYNVSPKQVKVKNPITGKEKVIYSEASAGDRFGVVFDTYQSSPFWKTFDTLASSAKKLELGFSGFHAGALTEVYMVQNMVEFGPKKAMANFMKYIFADTAKNHELPCFANPEDFQEAASHLVKFGATNDYAAADVQNMFDNMRDAMMKVQEKLKDGNKISGTVARASMPLKVATQMLSLINKGMDVALWDFLHDGLKLATYRMRADKTKERAKKKGWTEEELSRALDEDGQFVNDMFGGQHWDVLGASHRTLRYAGRVLLSPDWNASTTRHFLALTGFGSIWNEATFENFKQYYKRLKHKELTPEDEGRRSRQISALLCYGIGFMVFYEGIANGINAAFRALDEEKERKKAEEIRKTNPSYKSMYELAYGDEGMKWYDYLMRGNSLGQQSKIFLGRYEDGTEMYVRHGKQFREVPEYLFNHKGELEFPGPMVQRMIGKANPMVRMTLDDINYLSDFQASHADQEIQRKYGKTIGLLYKDALYWAPFLIPSQENKEFKAVDFFFPSSKGFSPWKAQSYFKDFILSGDMEGVVMTYQSCQRNGIDPEAQIKAAIGSVKALESAEMSDGVTSLQEASKRFDAAKSITEKKKMRQKMKKFLSQSDYKAFTQKEALDMVQGYLNGDEDLKEMEKAESKYLMKAKAEDVTEDWRIQNVWNGTMETYQEYQRLKDVDKTKANAFKNSKTNKRLFAARKAISAAKRKMNKAKKQMDGTNDAAKLVEIRNTRKELLKTLNGME
jgi:site-specific DNA-cytosine methylase